VVGGVKKIDRWFFTHNSGFDFAVAIEKTEGLSEVTEIIKERLQAAELMLRCSKGMK
jgi:elongation factor P hydroxylase